MIGGALAVGGIAAAVGGSGGSSSSKDSTPVNPMENAERLVSQAETTYQNALEILEQAQQDGLITLKNNKQFRMRLIQRKKQNKLPKMQ